MKNSKIDKRGREEIVAYPTPKKKPSKMKKWVNQAKSLLMDPLNIHRNDQRGGINALSLLSLRIIIVK